MWINQFEEMLTGGHPNSLGRVEEVVAIVLADKKHLPELYDCYFSEDEVVRLRVSSCFKRICKAQPRWLVDYIDRFLTDIAAINQASTQWTLALLFLWLDQYMTAEQHDVALKHMKHNLKTHDDWIVQNTTMETLGIWAQKDAKLKRWLIPLLEDFTKSSRKSVAGRARKLLNTL